MSSFQSLLNSSFDCQNQIFYSREIGNHSRCLTLKTFAEVGPDRLFIFSILQPDSQFSISYHTLIRYILVKRSGDSWYFQRAWFISRLAPCSFLTMAYQTRIEMCEGLLFGCSNVFPLKSDRWIAVETEHLRGLFSSITETMFSFVIYPMMNLKITDLHYSLLKACVFFSAGK